MLIEEDDRQYQIREIIGEKESILPWWGYLMVFILPCMIGYTVMQHFGYDTLFSGIVALAIMNGSINSVIAWLTIRLDGHSAEALEHLDTIMTEMDKLEGTLDEANEMVANFTGDLDSAKELFDKVGVDLDQLDLEPVAEVVEKLKENKDGFNEILDNMKDVDVSQYIRQAKQIDWQALLNAAEDIMGFIKTKGGPDIKPENSLSVSMPKLPDLDDNFFAEESPFEPDDEPLTLSPPTRKKVLNLDPPKR